MKEEPPKDPMRGFLFSVDILIEDTANGRALERLLRRLNDPDIKDYKIKEGIELGKWIEAAMQIEKAEAGRKDTAKKAAATPPVAGKPGSSAASAQASPKPQAAAPTPPAVAKPDIGASGKGAAPKPDNKFANTASDAYSLLVSEIERYKTSNLLVRLTVVKGKGIKLSIPCRILNYDAATQNVSVYHVDEKTVYTFRLNEIDDLQAR